MKKILFFKFLLLSFLSIGQTVTVSEEVTLREDKSYDIIGDERGNVLLFRNKGNKFEVQGYDRQMKQRWEKEIELDRKNSEVLKVVPLGGDFCVIYQFRFKSDLILKAQRYSSGANLIDSITIKIFESTFFTPNFNIELSENKKAALIWHVRQQNDVSALSFNMDEMKLLWEKSFMPEGLFMPRDFQQMLVDNGGNMYLVLLKDNQSSRNRSHYLEIFDYGLGTEEILRRYIVPMKDYLTYDVYFSFDNLNNTLTAGGLYSSNNPARAEGFYYLRIAQSNTEDQFLCFHPFEHDFVNVLLEKEKTKNKGLPEVSVQDIVLRTDGGIILIGELNKSLNRGGGVPTGYYTRGSFRTIIDYYFDDVFLISIHPTGDIHWIDILHKKQYSQDDGAIYSSFFIAKTPTALRLIFNDEIKSENIVSEYVIRGDGKYDRKAVMNTERKELMLRLRDAIQISANEIIIPSERRSRLKLVRVAY